MAQSHKEVGIVTQHATRMGSGGSGGSGGVETGVSLQEELLNMESQTWDALKQSGKALIPFLTSDWYNNNSPIWLNMFN